MEAPRERYAFVAALAPDYKSRSDALLVVDVDLASPSYGSVVGRVDLPDIGDELHHFGWNACSAALCPYAPHPQLERRYLVVPGIRSSRIHIIDTKPDPQKPEIVKTIEPEEIFARTGYSRPHTVHCGPEGIYVSALGAPDGSGPGGIFILDHFDFNVLGRWEVDRGPQELAYDFWWHLGHDTLISSEWGTPNKIENGIDPETLLSSGYGHQLHIWDLRRRKHRQSIDLGKEQQMVLELRPSHDPTRTFGFAGVVVSLKDLSASIWLWKRDNGRWSATKVIEIPAEPADPDLLPALLKSSKPFRRWSQTSIFLWMTNGSMSPAGAPGNSAVTMSPSRNVRNLPRSFRLAESFAERLIQKSRMSHSTGDRRWSKSAEMVNASILPTPSMHPGMSNFIRTGFAPGLFRQPQNRMAR